MLAIDALLDTISKHGHKDLSDTCEVCVAIKDGINEIVENKRKLQEVEAAFYNIHFTDDGEVFQNKIKEILGIK